MDFASLMKSQIAASKSKSGSKSAQEKEFLKRSEVESQREENYRREQEALEAQRRERLAKKRKAEEDEATRKSEREEKKRRLAEESRRLREEEEAQAERARRKRLGLPELPDPATVVPEGGDGLEDVDEVQLVKDLRDLAEPIRLFGENRQERVRRWRKVTGKDDKKEQVLTKGPIPTTIVLVQESEMKVPAKAPKDEAGKEFLYRQLASYFTMVLEEWQDAMASRDDEVKESYPGKQAYNAMLQARDNLRPFFKKLEQRAIDQSVLDPVVEIVHAAQERRYVDANDGYLRLSIGKAAWPIGVTMVGIHERSAREKLHESDNTAHIMSDETTRKYLQSIKRCLSFAQTRWPPDDHLQLMG